MRQRLAVLLLVRVVSHRQRDLRLVPAGAALPSHQDGHELGAHGVSRSASVLDGMMCSNGTSFPVDGGV